MTAITPHVVFQTMGFYYERSDNTLILLFSSFEMCLFAQFYFSLSLSGRLFLVKVFTGYQPASHPAAMTVMNTSSTSV